ncbi:siderophore iron transporter mirB [Dactylonectria macrodidyma]|uniref:Siderophore iron transporter mirB n=1 Tax=Dactylonectria macrodidyma TaxID=307937 RepID=A0A9P9IRY9_9HYPO|nr:siderophore iron transporter mirB [Dactylonectria macrodidyma]
MAAPTQAITDQAEISRLSIERDVEKRATADDAKVVDPEDDLKDNSDANSEDFQGGVAKVRAVTETWSKTTLWLMFFLLFMVSFVDNLMNNVQSSLNPYITSSFNKHGLLASVSVVATIVSGCSKLTLAKIIDVWGRIEGFLCMLVLVVVSLIMKATCKNMEAYVGAHTLYWVGHIGLMYVIDVMLADMTSLRNRMIMFGLNGTPLIASTFAGPKIADLFYNNLNFRWAFGAFAIMMTGVCIPVVVVMLIMQRKAREVGALAEKESTRNTLQSIVHYFIEFDVIGIILITAVFSLVLLPFSIATYAPNGWASGYIIAMEVLGVACVPVFYIWERRFARVQFLLWKYLKEPTIIGSCLLYGIMFASVFAWNAYFGSYLQVVHRLDITSANYVLNAFSLTSAIFGPIIGWLISYTGEFKWTAYSGVPIMLLGTALLIPFRQPSTHVGILTMTQILNGLGTGIFATCGQIAVMSPVTHQQIAVVIALWGMFGSIGAGIGLAVAGAIWNNVLPKELHNRLPEESKNMTATIFGDMVIQMSYEDGTLEREAIVGAYADVQRKMVIAGAALVPLCLASIWIWRNINIKKVEEEKGVQTKGNVW